MLSHVMIGSNDLERTKKFYNSVLGLLGAREPMVDVNATGQTRLFYIHGGSTISMSEPINGEPFATLTGSPLIGSLMLIVEPP